MSTKKTDFHSSLVVNPSDSQSALSTRVNQSRLNPAQMYLLRMNTEQSRDKVLRLANTIARLFGAADLSTCDWSKMRREHLLLLRTNYEKLQRAPSTINLLLCVMKGIAEEAWNLRLIDDHEYAIIKNVKSVRGSREPHGRALSQIELNRLFATCDNTQGPRAKRDAAVLALGVGCGLRRAEIAGLQLNRVHREDSSLSIIGKGNKERHVYCSETVWGRLEEWLKVRGDEGVTEVFCHVHHGSRKTKESAGTIDVSKPMTVNNIYMILSDFKKRTADALPFAPHDLRRTFATRLFEYGADLNTVRKAMGHASITTTQRYDKRDEEEVKRVSRRIQI